MSKFKKCYVKTVLGELGTTSDEPKKQQYSMRGFGTTFDVQTGRSRKWYFVDGVKRWADNDEPYCA